MLARTLAVLFAAFSVSAGIVYYKARSGGPYTEGGAGVERALVCMAQNRISSTENISVEMDGRTYYACCPNCIGRLLTDGRLRYAVDPATGNAVDKAEAFIVSREDGTVIYFESEGTARDYRPDLEGI